MKIHMQYLALQEHCYCVSSQLCYLTVCTTCKNTGEFVDVRKILMLCYYGENMEEYWRYYRWEDNINAILPWRRYGIIQEAL